MLWDTITRLGLDNMTDATIADQLQPMTAQDIPVADVRTLLRERGLWLKDPLSRARSFGTIGVVMQSPSFPPDLYEALVALEAALYDGSAEHLSTATRPAIAAHVDATVAGLEATNALTVADSAAFWELGGGQPFVATTAEDVAAARAAAAEHNATLEVRRRFDDAWNIYLSGGDGTALADELELLAQELR